MKTRSVQATVAGLLLFLSSMTASSADYFGLTAHVVPAYSAAYGTLYLSSHSRIYFKSETEKRPNGTDFAETYWLLQGGIGVIYGFNDHLQFGLDQILYQDTHRSPGIYNFPDDLFLHAKLAGFGGREGNVRFGIQGELRVPTAAEHNLALEPYSAGRLAWGIKGLFSIISEPSSPTSGINIHANVGYLQHNDLGLRLSGRPWDPIFVEKNTSEWIYGIAVSRALPEVAFFAELYGHSFAQRPPITAYTRENHLYFAPGIGYRANRWLTLRIALDLRILGGKDETCYDGQHNSYTPRLWRTVPNLPGWRLNIGSLISLPLKKSSSKSPANPPQQKVVTEKTKSSEEEAFRQLLKEQQKAENAASELEKIRAERQRMEDLLERLRKILEGPTREKSDRP